MLVVKDKRSCELTTELRLAGSLESKVAGEALDY